MIELPLVLVAGLLGSSHCLGMCGPFALTIGSTTTGVTNNLWRQLAYSAGRLFTYVVLGAMAGYLGMRLSDRAAELVHVPAVLAILAGLFLLYQGLRAAGVWPGRPVTGSSGPCLAGTFFGTFLQSPSLLGVFLAGVFTGFLPCGLLYGILALAASSQSIWIGGALMGAFALGTMPLMVATGLGGSLLSVTARRSLFRIAAWCVVLTGCLTVARGVGFLNLWGSPAGGSCPMCG